MRWLINSQDSFVTRFFQKLETSLDRRITDIRVKQLGGRIKAAPTRSDHRDPVVFFNASTRIDGLSLNAAFSLLTSWSLELSGVPVMHFVCNAGMSRCILGTNRDDVSQSPPCERCVRHSNIEYGSSESVWFPLKIDQSLDHTLQGLSIQDLSTIHYQTIPLGQIVLPSIRWELRRHNLIDDDSTRFLFRQFILSAYNVHQQFNRFLDMVHPQAIVLFNGQFFPEAMAKYTAVKREIRVVTHEVGLAPHSAFFTEGEATAYPIEIPQDTLLTDEQNNKLDTYLEQRFQGNFKMAGIQFWREFKGLDDDLMAHINSYKSMVSIFTNVIFDTSQPHSNIVFKDMFHWLDQILVIIKANPEILFIIRAHPDELRPGTAKQARETVREWVSENHVRGLKNVIYIDAVEYISSYELIQRSKFVLVYNSSIGLEASIMGIPVISAGKARFTQYPTVYFPPTINQYIELVESFLKTEKIEYPAEFIRQSRLFLYYQLFRTSLPFGQFIEDRKRPGLVKLKQFDIDYLLPDRNQTMKTIQDGIFLQKQFLLDEE